MDPPPDGLVCASLKPHSREKLLVLGYYLEQFTGAMHRHFPNLIYVDLYGGPGRGEFPSKQTIDGSPIIAARTVPPFTKIIAAEADEQNAEALDQRLGAESRGRDFKVFRSDCNEIAKQIRAEIPSPTLVDGEWVEGVLSFCFVDPFDLGIHFDTIREFADLKVDFLVLIADQMAGGRSEEYLMRPDNSTVDKLLGDLGWRTRRAENPAEPFRDFIHREFEGAMVRLGFKAGMPMRVNVQGKGVKLYRLCFFSKSDLGIKFWESARKNAPSQGLLFS